MAKNWYKRKQRNHHSSKNNSTNKGSMSDKNDNKQSNCNRKKATLTNTATSTTIQKDSNCNSSKISETLSTLEMQQINCDKLRDQTRATTTIHSDDNDSNNNNKNNNNNNNNNNNGIVGSNDNITNSDDASNTYTDTIMNNDNDESGRKMIVHDNLKEDEETTDDDEGKIDGVVNTTGFYNSQGRKRHSNDQERDDQVSSPLDAHEIADPDYNDIENETKSKSNVDDDNDEDTNDNASDTNDNASDTNDTGSSNEKESKKGDNDSARNDKFVCPVCSLKLDSQHSFTVHIRQHNPADHSHTCRLCGKTLSSASSLDRHMLIHSGERPFKCRICNMAFTTNGNMHRHMRTHGMELNQDYHSSDGNNASKYVKSRKRKNSSDTNDNPSHNGIKSPKTKNSESDETSSNYNKIECYCPVCNKPFPSKSALHSHMESHPNDPVCCRDCGMILKNYATYTQHRCSAASSDSTFYNVNKMNFGTPNSVGFYDLSFTDFTSRKFPMIAKSFCEHNFRKASSSYHDFECEKCHRSFPCGSALNLHQSSHNGETYCNLCHCDFPNPATFLSHQIKHRFDLSIFGGSYSPTHNFMSSQTGLLNGLNSSYGDVPQSEKDDFLALLNLQNRGAQFAIDNNYKFVHQDDIFDNSNYFIHAKPIPSKPTTFHPKIISNTTTDIEGVKPDLADIQSIISVTSSATPLISSIRSSPQAASPASPIQLGISGTKPDSPVPADSANASPNAPALNSCCNNSEVSDEKETCENHCDESKKNVSPEKNQEENSDKETDQTKKFKCSRCVLVFKSANALKRHNRGHIQGGHSYACHLCPYTSLDKSTLVRHLRTHNGERPFQCAICKYAFTTKANCERHVRKRHKKLNKQEIRNAMQYNPNMSSTSSLNNQSTKSEAALSPNSDSFPGGFDTVCKYCNVDFKFNRVLRHHLRSLHNSCSRKPYTCTVCKLGFSTKNNCIRHVVKQHPDMKDKLSTVVLSNANSFTSNSEHSETESFHRESPDLHGIQSNESLNLSNCLSKNDSITSENSQTSQHSSLAALCQIAKNISLPSDKPINLTVGDSNKKSQSNTSVNANFDQPLNLASKSHEEQPLDLAVHALDLSCKNSPSNFSLFRKDKFNNEELKQFSSEAVRNAASSLLALRSMASTGVFSSSGLLANSPLFNPVVSLTSPLPAHSSSMSMLSPISNTSIEDMYKGTSTFRIAKNRLMPKNERSFTCVYCSAGFTLKSNMERHIKRKHPEFARPPRSRGQINANLQEIAQNNSSASSLLSKANNSATLSSKTRDALRVVLSNKVLASGSSNKSNSRPGSPYSSNSNQSDLKICDEVSDGNNGDLASVSSLIDHTASSSNALKQYFNNKNNDDGDSNTGELNLQSESFRPNDAIKNDKISKKSKDSNVSTNKTVKKRSAYTDSPNSVSCPYCSRKFPWTSSLRRHILTHTGLKPYKCPKCPILFTTKSNCERHLVRKHNGKDKKPELPVVNPDNKQFKCNICPNSSFTTRGNLRKHHYLRHWTKTGSNLSNTNTNNNNDKNQVNKNFDISIGSEDNQSIPINEDESNNFNFKCYICELSFSGRLKCLDHLKSVHSNEYQILYSKGAVDKMPSPDTKLDLDYQAEQVDGQEKIFCVFCPRQFLLLDNLRRHMRVHLGERPFKCTLCTKKFSLKNSLLRHYRTNHPDAHVPKGKSKLTSSQFNLSKTPESLNLTQSAKSKSSCNSLLYLMPPKDNENPHDDQIEAQTTDTSENDNAEGSDLIQNLLGLQDSKMLDEILNSADSAARILGVKDV